MYIAWPLLLVALSSSEGNLVVLDLVRSLWWNMGTELGGAEPVGRLSRARTSLESRVESPLLPDLKSQVYCLGAKRCVNSLGSSGNSMAGRYGPLCAQRAGAVFFWFRCYFVCWFICPYAKHISRGLCGNSWIRRSGVGATCHVHQYAQQAGIFLFWSSGHK